MTNVKRLMMDLLWLAAWFGAAVGVHALVHPSAASLAVDVAIVAGLLAATAIAVIHLPFPETVRAAAPDPGGKRVTTPRTVSRVSFIAILAGSLAAGAITAGHLKGEVPDLVVPVMVPRAADSNRHALRLDGDRDGDEVVFDHAAHQDLLSMTQGCQKCHHLHKPGDFETPCRFCHQDMERETCLFNHGLHQEKLGGNTSCAGCHNPDLPRGSGNARACLDCHDKKELSLGLEDDLEGFPPQVPSYQEAMLKACLTCHYKMARSMGEPGLAGCDCCHKKVEHDREELKALLGK